MIDRRLIETHPASQVAAQRLHQAGWPADQNLTPLLRLTTAYLEANPQAAPGLLERARLLAGNSPVWAAAILTSEYEAMEADLAASPKGAEWPALKPHLDSLAGELRRAASPRDAARLLAENLDASLRHVYPSYSPR